MKVSVILCSRNRREHLEATLESLRAVRVSESKKAELVLVDSASEDDTYEAMCRYMHPDMDKVVIRLNRKGLGYARNKGKEVARGRVLVFTDDDIRFPTNWLDAISDPILKGEADAVQGGVVIPESLQPFWLTSRLRSVLASTERMDPAKPERLVGANMAISREVFNTIPAFDEELGAGGKYGSGEETLFSKQMLATGFRIKMVSDCTVEHHFDVKRLSREAWMGIAKAQGRSSAYINYHWEHKDYPLHKLVAGLIYYRMLLLKKIITAKRKGKWSEDVMPEWEFLLRRKIYRMLQYVEERGSSRKYARCGCVKVR
ncbi:MAG: hypothetical protein KatS3mg042_0598 [Rhodothermaceae bacterium]|nr:MAG: hypothetical protein KatS3mg042_0598 [Rhodothermaceae bacterium]